MNPSGEQEPDPGSQQPGRTAAQHSRDPSLSLSYLSHESLFGNSQHSPPIEQSVGVSPCDNGSILLSPTADGSILVSPTTEGSIIVSPSMEMVTPTTDGSIIVSRSGGEVDSSPGEKSRGSTQFVKDGNLVTIVQTTDTSQVIGHDSVIVTVSGTNDHMFPNNETTNSNNQRYGEVQILAHL